MNDTSPRIATVFGLDINYDDINYDDIDNEIVRHVLAKHFPWESAENDPR